MNNLNIGVLVSSILAATGLGVYVYMNNNDNDNQLENVKNEYIKDVEEEEEDSDKYIKSNKKSVSIKTKRRNSKLSGTRRKR
jgi:hypothetical protein